MLTPAVVMATRKSNAEDDEGRGGSLSTVEVNVGQDCDAISPGLGQLEICTDDLVLQVYLVDIWTV